MWPASPAYGPDADGAVIRSDRRGHDRLAVPGTDHAPPGERSADMVPLAPFQTAVVKPASVL